MPQAPNQYDPYSHPEAAQQRRNLVLKEMLDMKTISNKQYEAAVNTPVTDGLQSLSSSSSYPAYMDNYLKEVIEQVERRNGLQFVDNRNGCLYKRGYRSSKETMGYLQYR